MRQVLRRGGESALASHAPLKQLFAQQSASLRHCWPPPPQPARAARFTCLILQTESRSPIVSHVPAQCVCITNCREGTHNDNATQQHEGKRTSGDAFASGAL